LLDKERILMGSRYEVVTVRLWTEDMELDMDEERVVDEDGMVDNEMTEDGI
jgi:hypothetical protein